MASVPLSRAIGRAASISSFEQPVVYRCRRSHLTLAVGAFGQESFGRSRHKFDVAEGV